MRVYNRKGNKLIYQGEQITKFLVISKKYGNVEILVDTQDWGYIKLRTWYIVYDKTCDGFYVASSSLKEDNNRKRPLIKLHRFIFGLIDSGIQIDHINHNGLDNRRCNLRICTIKENNRNKPVSKSNTQGYKGIYWRPQVKKWQVQLRHNGKIYSFGYFSDKILAAKTYNAAAIKLHGEFACLNKI